jgi:hypothetical protein
MSDTPETDAATWLYEDEAGQGFNVVDVDVARKLEREREEARRLLLMTATALVWCFRHLSDEGMALATADIRSAVVIAARAAGEK